MFNALSTLLESNTITPEVAEALDNEISGELKKLRDESSGLRVKNKELTSSFEEITGAKTALEAQLSDFDEKIKLAKDEGKGEVVKQLEAERQKQDELMKSLSGFEKENTRLKIANAVSTELSKYDVKSDLRGDAEVVLRSMVAINENGIAFGDGLSIEDGVKGYFETRGSYLKPLGDGNGSGAQGAGGNSGGANSMERTAFEKLQPGQKADFMAKGGKLV